MDQSSDTLARRLPTDVAATAASPAAAEAALAALGAGNCLAALDAALGTMRGGEVTLDAAARLRRLADSATAALAAAETLSRVR